MKIVGNDTDDAAAAATVIDPMVLTDLVAAITAKMGIGDAADARSRNNELHK